MYNRLLDGFGSTLLFNIVLEKVARNSQLLRYADDLDMIGRNVDIVKENYVSSESRASVYGLETSGKKTKYMVVLSSSSIDYRIQCWKWVRNASKRSKFLFFLGRRSIVIITSRKKFGGEYL